MKPFNHTGLSAYQIIVLRLLILIAKRLTTRLRTQEQENLISHAERFL